ncbi:hypothetical protein [uncultured Algibacter sp.]|uniref:hypothetical protein n=1 Tax=uncultured Algibacter sp. TaxID=298659 RepID=UPI0026109215|nr:hypothetical protein [uncultured Algibacter sp.]
MRRNIISLIFSTMFVLFLTAPTIILIIDNTTDISSFYISSEEEEKGHEKSKDKDLIFYDFLNSTSVFNLTEKESYLEYFFKNYPKPHLNLIFPPPDSYIL